MVDNLFIITITVMILYFYFIYVKHPSYEVVTCEEIFHKFKTGDLIFFHGLDNINSILVLSYFNHVGVVYKYNGKLYLFEAFNYEQAETAPKELSNGIALFDLKNRISTYRGYIFYKELTDPIDPKIEAEAKGFVDYSLLNMNYNPNLITDGLKNFVINKRLTNHTNCGELAYLMLIKLGILNLKNFKKNRKHHLRWLSKLKKADTNSYKEMVYVYPDIYKGLHLTNV